MKRFVNDTDNIALIRAVEKRLPDLSFGDLSMALRKRDVKINGVRVSGNVRLCAGDEVVIYSVERKYEPKIVYSDDNIVIADKKAGIESEELAVILSAIAVHRLDRNTEGLNVFAKNKAAESELLTAFRERTVDKFYLAEVFGHLKDQGGTLTGYLIKDAERAIVRISDKMIPGSVGIATKYSVIKRLADTDIVEIDLLTGKTHQIRAHFAHIGHPVAGDGKYGENARNKAADHSRQRLLAYKLTFYFKQDSVLCYLNGRTFLSGQSVAYGVE